MDQAYCEALKAFETNEVPVGAVIVENGKIIARGYNQKESKNSAIYHAEIIAILEACQKKNNWRLENCDIYITLEPCPMCASAIKQSRINNVYCGLSNLDKNNSVLVEKIFEADKINPKINFYSDLDAERIKKLMQNFFDIQRKK